MSDVTLPVIRSNDEGMGTPEPGLKRQVMSFSPSLMLVRHTMAAGWVGAKHSHPHEQLIYIVHGEIHFEQPNGKAVLHAGDSLLIPGGVEHQASAPFASEVLDVFTPMREEYAV
jgi:quercetin dioxygenase-like cupin family protein